MAASAEQTDVFHSDPIVFGLDSVEPPSNLFNPILQLNKPEIRISSMRMRENSNLVTLYNLENANVEVQVKLADSIKTATEVRMDGTVTTKLSISDNTISLSFSPREIKMCRLQ